MSGIRIVEVSHNDATFTVEMTERTIRALCMIGDFGTDSLTKAVAKYLSEGEAKTHAKGLDDLVAAGRSCKPAIACMNDARAVLEGRKVAVTPEKGA